MQVLRTNTLHINRRGPSPNLKRVEGSSQAFGSPLVEKENVPKVQSRTSPRSKVTITHKKLESALTQLDEKLLNMVTDHTLLQNNITQKEREAVDYEKKVVDLTHELKVSQDYVQKLKRDKEELMTKMKILLKENEKSNNLIQQLVKQEEELREEFNSVQMSVLIFTQMYQNQILELQQLNREQNQETFQLNNQLKQTYSSLQNYENMVNTLRDENHQLSSALQENDERSNNAYEEHISQLINQNEELSQQLIAKQKQLSIYVELEKKLYVLMQENESYKQVNDKLHQQIRKQEEILFQTEMTLPNEDVILAKDNEIQSLRKQLKNMEIKLGIMSEDNIRLSKLLHD